MDVIELSGDHRVQSDTIENPVTTEKRVTPSESVSMLIQSDGQYGCCFIEYASIPIMFIKLN